MKRFLYLLLFIAPVCCYGQQQITFSQYMFHGLVLNPAYATSDEALNVTFLNRKQWSRIKGSPEVQSLIGHKYYKDKRSGFGAMLENISYGVTKSFSFNGVYAYKVSLPNKAGLSLGLRLGLSSYKQDLTDLVLPQGNLDPSFNHNSTKTLFNSGFGAYYEAKKYYAGFTISGLVSNKLDKGAFVLARQLPHYFISGGYLFDVSPMVKIKSQLLIRMVSGAPLSTDISVAALLKNVVWVGMTFKYDNSVNGLMEVKLNEQFKIGFAYDIVNSSIARITTGTYEISLNYRYLKKHQHRVMSPRYF
jgi:type IX secretion system PorP/SprF family membrane protein